MDSTLVVMIHKGVFGNDFNALHKLFHWGKRGVFWLILLKKGIEFKFPLCNVWQSYSNDVQYGFLQFWTCDFVD